MDDRTHGINSFLLLQYIDGHVSDDEKALVETWLAESEENAKILLDTAKISHAVKTRKRLNGRNPYKALEKVHHAIRFRKFKTMLIRVSAAASFVVGVMGITLYFQNKPVSEDVAQMVTMTANRGMRTQLTLPDGTEVYLNSGTTITYPVVYNGGKRTVILDGEAYFDVAKDKRHPFVVSTSDGILDLEVLGTEFNIQAYKDEEVVRTTLVEGSVALTISDMTEKIIMEPSEMVTYDLSENNLVKERVNTELFTSWKDGRLVFRDTSMPEVLKFLSRYYGTEFIIEDEKIKNYTFTGSFENVPLYHVLDYLKITSNIEYGVDTTENDSIVRLKIR